MSTPTNQRREFALSVVRQLREAGFESLWAGGCVRDALLDREPKDYDVATSATPDQVINVFGKRKTVPVGVSFGVVMVLGPTRRCGQVEVASFRADGVYLDGRRPESVRFSSPEEDARRRDFTINGMFYDPVDERVIDYVGGQDDLKARIVRAIGSAHDRFAEDKLRMLRAVRFAATYDFELQSETADAVRVLAPELRQVSSERIAQELRRMLGHQSRATAVRQLQNVHLLNVIFPELLVAEDGRARLENVVAGLAALTCKTFEPALAMLLQGLFVPSGAQGRDKVVRIQAICRRLKLSNEELDTVCWVLSAAHACHGAAAVPLHVLKPLLADSRKALLIDYLNARALALSADPIDARFLTQYVKCTPSELLAPDPLIDGQDLRRLGVEPGPLFGRILKEIRQRQLDERIHTSAEAIAIARELVQHASE